VSELIKLIKIRWVSKKKFNASNLIVFKNITEYIGHSYLTYYEKEEALQQVMDIILQAQEENKSAVEVIGNYIEFSDAIIEEYESIKSNRYKVLYNIEVYLKWLSIFGVVFSVANIVMPHKAGFPLIYIINMNALALYLALFKNIKRVAVHKLIFGKINVRTYKNMSSTSGRLFIFLVALILPVLLSEQFVDYQVNFNVIISIIVASIIIIMAIELFKQSYNIKKDI